MPAVISELETGAQDERDELDARDERVRKLLEQMGNALTRGDTKVVAACWDTPSFVLTDDGAHAIASTAEIEQFFAGAKDDYNAQGIHDTRPEVEEIAWLTSKLASVDVRWPWLDKDGVERGAEHSRYLVRIGNDGELRLHIAIMRGVDEPAVRDDG